MFWLSKCSLYIPLQDFNPVKQDVIRHSNYISPIRQCLCFFHKGVDNIIPLVSLLFLSCRPLYIFRIVAFVIIYAVDAMLWTWSSTNVKQKNLVVIPFRTYHYAPSTIIFITIIIGVVTSSNHINPYMILRYMGKTMFFTICGNPVFLKTGTAFGPSGNKIPGSNHSYISTLAETLPHHKFVFAYSNTLQNSKPNKNFPSEVLRIVTSWSNLGFYHAAETVLSVVLVGFLGCLPHPLNPLNYDMEIS